MKALNIIGIIISLAVLAYLISWVDFSQIFTSIQKISMVSLLIIMAIYTAAFFPRAYRWKAMLYHLKPIGTFQILPIVVMGYFANNLLPAKLGEIVRVYMIQPQIPVRKRTLLATIFLERIFDGLCVGGLLLFSALTLSIHSGFIHTLKTVLIITLSGLILCVMAMLFFRDFFREVFLFDGEGPLKKVSQKIFHTVHLFQEGIISITKGHSLGKVILSTFIAWSFEALAYFILAKEFHLDIGIYQALIIMGFVNFGILIPSSPGYVGVFEGVTLAAFTFLGLNSNAGIAFGMVLHFCHFVPPLIWGLLLLATDKSILQFMKLKENKNAEPAIYHNEHTNES